MTDLTVTNWLVGHGVSAEVVTNHVGLDLDGVPVLAGVHFSDRADHIGHDDGVSQVSLHGLGLLTVASVLDGKLELLNKSVVLGVNSVLKSSALS